MLLIMASLMLLDSRLETQPGTSAEMDSNWLAARSEDASALECGQEVHQHAEVSISN